MSNQCEECKKLALKCERLERDNKEQWDRERDRDVEFSRRHLRIEYLAACCKDLEAFSRVVLNNPPMGYKVKEVEKCSS